MSWLRIRRWLRTQPIDACVYVGAFGFVGGGGYYVWYRLGDRDGVPWPFVAGWLLCFAALTAASLHDCRARRIGLARPAIGFAAAIAVSTAAAIGVLHYHRAAIVDIAGLNVPEAFAVLALSLLLAASCWFGPCRWARGHSLVYPWFVALANLAGSGFAIAALILRVTGL